MCTMYQLAGIVGVVAVVARYALNIQTLGDLWLRAQEVDFEADDGVPDTPSEIWVLMVSTGNAVWDAVKTALTDKVVGPTAITGVVLGFAKTFSDVLMSALTSLWDMMLSFVRRHSLISITLDEEDSGNVMGWLEINADKFGRQSEFVARWDINAAMKQMEDEAEGLRPERSALYRLTPYVLKGSILITYENRRFWIEQVQSTPGDEPSTATDPGLGSGFGGKPKKGMTGGSPSGSRTKLKITCVGGPFAGWARDAVVSLVRKARATKYSESSKWAEFTMKRGSKHGISLLRWLKENLTEQAMARYAVSAGDEQAKGIGTEEAEIDPMNYPIRRRKRTDTPHAKAPVGAAMENGDPNAMIFTPNSEGFQRVMFDKVCVYIRVGSPEDVDEVKVAINLQQDEYDEVGQIVNKEENKRNREWAQKMLEAICKEGRRLVDKDNATSITYHMKIGTECARYFEAWMNQQTKLGDEQARDVTVELSSASGGGAAAPAGTYYDGRGRLRMNPNPVASNTKDEQAPEDLEFEFKPDSSSTHKVNYEWKGEMVVIWASKVEAKEDEYGQIIGSNDYVVLVQSLDKEIMEEILRQGAGLQQKSRGLKTHVYMPDLENGSGLTWNQACSKPVRSISTVILGRDDNGAMKQQAILDDCREFLRDKEWYYERGIPYRRGYLLEGLPGTGKTSLVMALAGELRLPIYSISLTTKGLSEEVLRSLLKSTAEQCIVLFEDIDTAFVDKPKKQSAEQAPPESDQGSPGSFDGSSQSGQIGAFGKGMMMGGRGGFGGGRGSSSFQRGGGPSTEASSLSLGDLLQVLDGVYAQEGRLIVMTTNCVDKLDKALIRPGRVDFTMHFGIAQWEQVRDLFLQFYSPATSSSHKPRLPEGVTKDELEHLSAKFADTVDEVLLQNMDLEPVKKTACTIQNLLMLHARRDPMAAAASVKTFVRALLDKQNSEAGGDVDEVVEVIKSGSSIPMQSEVLAAHRHSFAKVAKDVMTKNHVMAALRDVLDTKGPKAGPEPENKSE